MNKPPLDLKKLSVQKTMSKNQFKYNPKKEKEEIKLYQDLLSEFGDANNYSENPSTMKKPVSTT